MSDADESTSPNTSPNTSYGEPPYRRTVWHLHRHEGRLFLEEWVLGADERYGEFTQVIRHSITPIDEMDDPPPAKFEEVGRQLADGQTLELDPASEFWDDSEDTPSEGEIARRAGELVADLVIPTLEKALRRAARELASEGYGFDWHGGARYILEALARYLEQDPNIMQHMLVPPEDVTPDAARQWFEDNLLD